MKNKIKKLRETKNPKWSQKKLALEAGLSRPYLSDIENEKSDPTGTVMFRIANALGYPVGDVFFDEIVLYKEHSATVEAV